MHTFKRIFILLGILAVLGGGFFVWYRIAGNSPEALRSRADENYSEGRFSEALLQYRMLLGKDPQNAHAYRRAGLIWMERGAPLRAIPFFQQALRLEPENVTIRGKWANILLSLGNAKAARQEALEILDSVPGDNEALLLLANTSFTGEHIAETRSFLESRDPATDPTYHLASAVLLAREGKTEEVAAALAQARKIAPDSPKVRDAFGIYHRAMGDSEEFLAILKTASEGPDASPRDRLRYAQVLAGTQRGKEAMDLLRAIVATHEDYLPAYLVIANLQAREEKFQDALETLENVSRIDPVNLEARSIEARVHLANKEPEKAVTVFENLEAAYPQAPRIKFALARCYLLNGEEVEARQTLTEAMKVAPELSRDHAEAILRLADLELRANNPSAAAGWLVPLVSSRPELREAQLLLARAYAADGRLEDAANLFRTTIEKNPDNPLGHFMLGQIFRLQKKNAEAIQSLETAQKLVPDDLAITAQLVELDVLEEDYSTAHQRLQHHLAKEPSFWGAWLLEGNVFSAEQKWSDAETAYQKALDLNPASLAVYDGLIDNYLRAGDPAKAIAQLETVTADQPDSLKHRMALSLLLEQQSEFERAAENYRKLLEDNPDFIPALNNLAYLYSIELEQLSTAETFARKARQLDANNPAVADTLGWVLVRIGGEERLQEGLRLIKEAGAGLPDDPEVQYHLGIALSQSGDREGARRALERAVKADSDFPGKEDAAKVLAAFEGAPAPGTSIAELEELRKNAPFNLQVRLQLGQLYRSRNEPAKATAAYREALKLDARNFTALKALAKLEYSSDSAQAREYARRAWEANPSDLEASALQGHWVFVDRRFAQAYTILRPSARAGRDPAVMREFAHAAFNIGKIAEAREMMQKIQAEAPEHAEAQRFLTLTATPADAAERTAMEAAADTALEADPSYAPALVVRAARLERSERPDAAIPQYEYLRQHFPDFHPATARLAALYAEDPAKLDTAEALGLQALEQAGSSPTLDRTLGEILARKDKATTAITYLERAAKTAPLDAEGLFFLGKSYMETEQEPKGRQTLEAAMKAGLSEDLAAAANALLKAE